MIIKILCLLIPFIILTLLNVTVSLLWNKPFGRTMTLSIFFCMLALYLSQLALKSFFMGFALILVIAMGAGPLSLLKRKQGNSFRWNSDSGLFLFVGICLFVFLWDLGRTYTIFDEFYFWGPMVKESLRLDRFYSVAESNIQLHKDYPPFITMMEYFWCRCAGGYSESAMSMAVHTTLLSASVLPIAEIYFKGTHKKGALTGAGATLSAVFLMAVFVLDPWTPRESTSILVDVLVSVIFAYAMYTIYKGNIQDGIFGIAELCALNTLIIMIKQVGIGFLAVIVFYGAAVTVLSSNSKGKALLKYIAATLIPLAISLSWKVYTRHLGITGQFDFSNISARQFLAVLTGEQRGLQHDTLKNYLIALIQKNISSSWLPVSYVSTLVIALIVLYLLHIWSRSDLNRNQALSIGASFICCTGGYGLVMAILYVFCFNEYEMRILASYERYMSSFVLGEFLLLIYIAFDLLAGKNVTAKKLRKVLFVIFMSSVLLAPGNLYYLVPQGLLGNAHAQEQEDAALIEEFTETGSSICLVYDTTKVSPSWFGAYRFYMLYYLPGRDYPWGSDIFSADFNNKEEVRSVMEEIKACDYLYVKDTKESLSRVLGEYADNGTINDNMIYRVVNDAQNLRLLSCNK